MGASNALAAYRLYSSKVTPLAMSTLAYMALVSLDDDKEPWFSLGAEMLAAMPLGRPPLVETGDAKEDARAKKAMEVACERALRPLFEEGAITTARHSSGHPGKTRHARYRLWLTAPAPNEERDPRHRADRKTAPHGNRGVQNSAGAEPASVGGEAAPYGFRGAPDDGTLRNPCPRPTESVAAPYEIRRAKEYEEYEERKKNLEEYSLLSSDSVPVGAHEARDGPDLRTPADDAPRPPRRPAGSTQPPLMAVVPAEKSPCQYAECPGRAEPVNDDGYHPSTCAYLVTIKPDASSGTRARLQPEASEPGRMNA